MGPRRILAGCLLFASLQAAGACQRPPVGASGALAVAVDSVEGVVRVVGVEGAANTVLVPDGGARQVQLSGSTLLPRVAGLRVAAVGKREGGTLVVSRFTVVAANGVRAVDGRLAVQGGGLVLVTPSGGRYSIAGPPTGLRAMVGHRVWVSGVFDGQTVAYGMID